MQLLKSLHPTVTRPRPYFLLLTLLVTVFVLACSGSDGLEGAEGPQGLKGDTGPQGVAGRDGRDGEAGADGVDGFVAAQGLQGPQGLKGDTGPQGIAGKDGANGRPGLKGDIGLYGADGVDGAAGSDGVDGAVVARNIPASNVITTLDSTANVGKYSSITIGADGLGLISYYDSTNSDLKVVHCANTFCSPYFRRR